MEERTCLVAVGIALVVGILSVVDTYLVVVGILAIFCLLLRQFSHPGSVECCPHFILALGVLVNVWLQILFSLVLLLPHLEVHVQFKLVRLSPWP